jgi:hypothetical protein
MPGSRYLFRVFRSRIVDRMKLAFHAAVAALSVSFHRLHFPEYRLRQKGERAYVSGY